MWSNEQTDSLQIPYWTNSFKNTFSLSLSLSSTLAYQYARTCTSTHTHTLLSLSLSVPFSTSSSLDRLSRLFPVIFMSLRCMPAHIQRPNPLFLSLSLSSLLPLFTLFLSFHQASCQLYVSLLFSLRRCAIFELQLSHRRKSHPRSFSNAVEMQSEALIRFGRWTKFEMSIVDKAFA